MLPVLASLTAGLGMALVVVALLLRARERDADLLRRLGAEEEEPDPDEVTEASRRVGLLEPAGAAAGALLARVDRKRNVATRLQRAAVPLRPGEYVVVVATFGLLLGVWLWAVSDQFLMIPVGLALVPLLGGFWLDGKANKRQRRFEEQLPDLLSSLASSVRGGHTLLRATSLLAEEAPEPTRTELERVLVETQLGVPVVDAFSRLAARVELRDLDWVVEAIRIQQRVGGQLADLLFTLADHLREREEVRREVKVLTAEGRLSTWVLSLLPVGLGVFMAVRSPDYIAPLFRGFGLVLLALAVIGIVLGATVISRMVRRIAR